MSTVAAKKKSPRLVRKPAPSRVAKNPVPADLRRLRAGAMKFSKTEIELMDRSDAE
jgi:hypothetical protein